MIDPAYNGVNVRPDGKGGYAVHVVYAQHAPITVPTEVMADQIAKAIEDAYLAGGDAVETDY